MAPVWLRFTADLKLRARGAGILPGQDPDRFGRFETTSGIVLGRSSTQLILQARRSIGLTLTIPMVSDEELREIVPWLQAELPMVLSAKHWSRWTVTKNGSSYRGRKVKLDQ